MVTTVLQGRLGNQFYQIAMLLAYCKKHDLEYYIPDRAYHCDGSKMYFPELAMGPEMLGWKDHHEQATHAVPKGDGTYHYNVPEYQDIPAMDSTRFVGYWQSFKYLDEYRDYIQDHFPRYTSDNGKEVVGIHLRYGDFKQLRDKHPEIPIEYYWKAIQHFVDQGYSKFFICSDDIEECKRIFTPTADTSFIFNVGATEREDWMTLTQCDHQILCYSTFGFTAAWMNQNPDKQVLLPPSEYCFSGANGSFIPEYFKILDI